jgi:hypothetical protein
MRSEFERQELGSSAYGPEAALSILIPLGAAGASYIGYVVAPILALLAVLYISCRQTIRAYPSNGGRLHGFKRKSAREWQLAGCCRFDGGLRTQCRSWNICRCGRPRFRNTKSARLHVAAVLGHSRFYDADDYGARSMPGGCLHCLLTRLWDAFCCCSLWVALTRFHLQVTRRLL